MNPGHYPDVLGMFERGRATPSIELVSMAELTASAAIVCVLAAIAVAARRHNLPELASRSTIRAGAYIVTVLASIAATYLVMVPVIMLEMTPLAALILIAIAVALLVLTYSASRLCREASAAFERGPGPPIAKLIR
jgi:hypothetical protein